MIQALGSRIIAVVIDLEEKKGGLILPGRKHYDTLKVVNYGSDCDLNLDVDDIIFTHADCGFPIEFKGTRYICLTSEQVLAVFRED